MFAEKPNAARAKLSRVTRGNFLLCHRAHLLRVSLSGKPGAVHCDMCLFQAALAAYHNPVLKQVAKRLKKRGKPHKLVIIAIARRLVTIANAIIKTGVPWQIQPGE
jgi:transposase